MEDWGPCFHYALALHHDMNEENTGICFTKSRNEKGDYAIDEDENGNNVLTGDRHQDEDGNKYFTCAELDVYLVE